MELKDLKTVLETTGTTGVKQVFLGYQEKPNLERDKLYPFVLWDYNTWEGLIDSRQSEETIKVRVYIVDYFDYLANAEETEEEEVYDNLRAIFAYYIALINTDTRVHIANLDKLLYKLYHRGLWIDSEIGISYELELKLFC